MSILARKKGLILKASVAPDFPNTVVGDEKRLQQILINLIGNSIKFTKQGEVSVELSRSGLDKWCIRVSDTGVGISEKDQTLIFEPFHKVDRSLTGDNRGTGLGLSITKQLVDLMEGQINLQSTIGKGSKFTVVLPFIEKSEDTAQTKSIALIINNDPKLVHILETILEELGFEIEIDMTGKQYLDLLSPGNTALIVLDLKMPFASGSDIFDRIRSDERWAKIPVIITSADKNLAEAFKGRVEEILIKPFEFKQLREAVKRVASSNKNVDLSLKKQ
jgi:CheY-like chemotaxis protein/anti-sigma regulatory factor (Ser/Thr protein kinase)